MRLDALGERKITESILPGLCQGVGDDCCYFRVGDYDLVVTTDPVPLPAANAIAGDKDWYWAGRLLVTINASDLAAAGARPAVFVAAIECPAATEFDHLQRLFKGIADACQIEGLEYSGGNLKEAASFAATGTAVGTVSTGAGLHRTGAGSDDLLFSVGLGGEFWRDALKWKTGARFPKEASRLFAPTSQLSAMQVLRPSGLLSCSMDNSDGLLATLEQLARLNMKHITFELDGLRVADVDVNEIEQARLWLDSEIGM